MATSNNILKTTIVNTLEDVNRMILHFNISLEDLFNFEKMIIGNDLNSIKEYVHANSNAIYLPHLLCNGYYHKKYDCHPTKCHNIVCYKTPVYYALWMNCYYYSQIFDKVKVLSSLSSKPIIKEILKFVYELPCVCHVVTQTNIYYNHTNMNFKKVNDFLKIKIEEVFNTFVDTKANVTKQTNCKNVFMLKCDHILLSDEIQREFIINEIDNYDKIGNIIHEIKYIWEDYICNCDIVKYLFSVQSYEYYNYYLNHKPFELDNSLDTILLNVNSDINFCKTDDDNILYNTMKTECKKGLITRLISEGTKLPKNKNLETMFDKECPIENIKEFLKTYDAKYFSNDSLMIILGQNLLRSQKIEIVNIFSTRGFLTNAIKILLESSVSLNTLINLYKNDDVVVNRILIDDAFYCIKLEKYKELDLILSHNKIFVNMIHNESTPVMMAIKENKLNFLELLLQHGADPFLIHNGISPIMMTIIENRLEMLEFLLKNCMKSCSTSDNTLHVMLTIKENKINILELLLKYGADPYTPNNHTTPCLYAIEQEKNVALECLLRHGLKSNAPNSITNCMTNCMSNNIYKNISPLVLCINQNKIVALELLLQYGANPYVYNNDGLNALHHAILKNRLDIVAILKDHINDGKQLINEITRDENKHSLFLAIGCTNPLAMTDLLLQSTHIKYDHILNDDANILYFILMSKITYKTKVSLFQRYITKDVDLLNVVDSKPLVVYAVENNMYDIVVMIMNKLLLLGEITCDGFSKNDNDIIKIINGVKKIQIHAKNKNKQNFYSLVVLYLKSPKSEFDETLPENENYICESDIIKPIIENQIIIMLIIIVTLTLSKSLNNNISKDSLIASINESDSAESPNEN